MAAENKTVIETVELTKVYRDFWGRQRVKALDGLNMEVRQGEVFGLLGPNGSGKTTCIRLVLGLLFPTQGLVRMFGRSPRLVDVKKRVGYMPEESHFYGYLNAEETLDFFGRLFRLTRSERRSRADALIAMVGLERARKRPIGEFSKGMARRIGLAQALINDPDLLILDEPTTGLDPIGTREMKDLITTLKKRGKTIFLCSHLLADVEEVCDRVCVMYGGKSRSMGNVSELLKREEVTQIRSPRLPAHLVEQVKALIRENIGMQAAIEVGSPSRKLEDYFLEVVEQARRDKAVTTGAEAGGPAAEFLLGEPEGEVLVEELVSAGKGHERDEAAPYPASPTPEALPGITEDRELISELVSSAQEPAPESDVGAPGGVREAQSGGTAVRHELIDDLTEAGQRSKQKDEAKRADDGKG